MGVRDKLEHLPDKPGVYLFKDEQGGIIYVGKARSLRPRVRSYFHAGAQHGAKVQAMLRKVADFDFIITDNEVEALILESNLVKEHQPWYNIRIKDDKHYPYLKLTVQEQFPRLRLVRRIEKDGAKYYGPFPSASAVRETMRVIRRLFPMPTCKKALTGSIEGRPCLNLHIGRCPGPCTGQVSVEAYRQKVVESVDMFLNGRFDILLADLEGRMAKAAEDLNFELAAELRDQIESVKHVMEKQKMISAGLEDRDIIALARGVEEACVSVFRMREGRALGRDNFFLSGTEEMARAEVLSAFIKQYYATAVAIPGELLLSVELPIEEEQVVATWLQERRGRKVQLTVPRRGPKKQLVEMVEKNALAALEERFSRVLSEGQLLESALEELALYLALPSPPRRIECYDISNISGTQAVGSMVVMLDGKAAKEEYRRFRITGITGPDDFAMMAQVIRRRFQRVLAGDSKFSSPPDLLIVDGGKGQLSSAREVMEQLGFGHIPTAGLAKEHEHIFQPGRKEAVVLPPHSQSLYLVQRLRDEAHRFALAYHRQLRSRSQTASLLEGAPGIGEARRKALLKYFGSLRKVQQASVEELAQVPGMSYRAAEQLYTHLRSRTVR